MVARRARRSKVRLQQYDFRGPIDRRHRRCASRLQLGDRLAGDRRGGGYPRLGHQASANAAPTSPFKDLISSEQKLSWFGTVRGRLGVTVTPDLLLYGTGGLAYGRVEASANSRLLIGEVISAEAEDIFGVVRKCQQEQSRLDRGRRRRMDVRCTLTSAASPRSEPLRVQVRK